MHRVFLLIASAMGFLSVALGAFAAHGLENILSVEMIEVFETGVHYQMFHVTALLAVALLSRDQECSTILKWSGYMFTLGIVLFSGSLFVLSLTGIKILGIITPLGGVAFLVAWVLLFVSVYRENYQRP